jgi:hypothetical protein
MQEKGLSGIMLPELLSVLDFLALIISFWLLKRKILILRLGPL